jgi:hypothetical protein
MSVRHENLSSAFAPTNTKTENAPRGQQLKGLLPPRAATKPAPAATAPTTRPAARAAVPPAAGEAAVSDEPVEGNQEAASKVENRGAYIPFDLLLTLKARKNEENSTYTDILIDAFDVVSDPELAEKFNPASEVAGSGGGMPRRRRTTLVAKSGTQIQLRLDKDQEHWLTAKEKAVGAPSRSALVTAAYELYFAMTPKPKHR